VIYYLNGSPLKEGMYHDGKLSLYSDQGEFCVSMLLYIV